MWIYNKKENRVDERPIIRNPKEKRSKGWYEKNEVGRQQYNIEKGNYQEHIKSLQSFPVSGQPDWKDGEDVTGKFEIINTHVVSGGLTRVDEVGGKGLYHHDNTYAVPLPVIKQESENELPQTEVRETLDGWTVRFTIGVQTFSLFEIDINSL